MKNLNANKIIIALFIIYAIFTLVIPRDDNIDQYGRKIILPTYALAFISAIVIRVTGGDGFKYKNNSMLNPDTRKKIINNWFIWTIILLAIGVALSLFVYKAKSLSYLYDFISLIVIALLSWNILMLLAGRVDQLNDEKNRKK
ncbi:MAG: hypothetical protein SOZ40_06500 [Ezakiella sp.]|nr:hypothetical protein [Ezakiella sp.]